MSEMVYGTTLRLPGKLVDPRPYNRPTNLTATWQNYADFFNRLHSTPTRRQSQGKVYLPKNLNTCTHVYTHIDATRKSLESVYTGPHLVLKRGHKVFTVQLQNSNYEVSTDRLKPAYMPFQKDDANESRRRTTRTRAGKRCPRQPKRDFWRCRQNALKYGRSSATFPRSSFSPDYTTWLPHSNSSAFQKRF